MEIKSYRDLQVWQLGRVLVRRTYALTQSFPQSELYGLTSQMRRAAVSVPSNIAEGHSRHSTADFISFISIAIGSLSELDTQLILSMDIGYLSEESYQEISVDIATLQRQLHSLRQKLSSKKKLPSSQPPIPNPQSRMEHAQ